MVSLIGLDGESLKPPEKRCLPDEIFEGKNVFVPQFCETSPDQPGLDVAGFCFHPLPGASMAGRVFSLPFHIFFVACLLLCDALGAQEEVDSEGLQFFEKHIRPVLVKECYDCHSAESDEIEGGLTLDTRVGIRKGGDRGPAVVPGHVRQSLLIEAIRHTDDDLKMPQEKKLSAEVISNFEKWIDMGAPDPRDGEAVIVDKYKVDMEKGRMHWAFRPPEKAEVPHVKQADWPRTDVDRFVIAAMEPKGLTPIGDADRRTLLRRLTFDLTGLPPTSDEMEAFAHENDEASYEDAVDRLLASPQYGEKWARHWLDVARYAESTGKTVNFYYPHAWRYRDYVIAAFNADKPYDQFIKEQLAGDLMTSDDPDIEAERLIATGFLALGPKTLNERSGLKYELDVVDEQIDVTTQAFLGITVACSRCHDHKFDPIPQTDYYAIAGIFRSTETRYGTVSYINAQRATPLISLPEGAKIETAAPRMTDRERQQVEAQIQSVRDSIRSLKDGIQQFFSQGRISLLQAQLDACEVDGTPKRLAMGVRDKPAKSRSGSRGSRGRRFGDFTFDGMETIGDTPVFERGEPDQPRKQTVPRGTLQVLTSEPLAIPSASSGRLELANWIASRQNPLTARVMVNRIWLQLFGRGLVPTPDDFGLAGRPPSHPELLDHLAVRFMDDGWSVRKLIKYLVMSRVYQLSTTADAKAMEVDPDNTFFWRMQPRRLDAECVRDAILAVSGQLELNPPVGSAVARSGEGPVSGFSRRSALQAVNDPKDRHRSIYLPVIRDNLPEAMGLFDGADPSLITASREQTTVPSQGLFLLNNEFVLRAADAAAKQLLKVESEPDRIRAAFFRFYGRPSTEAEQAAAERFIVAYKARLTTEGLDVSRQNAEVWSAFSQAVFASAEFQYRK